MIVLPIVGRELRVASRRRGTYWLRVLAAAVALVFCGITLITLQVTPSFTAAGGRIFMFLMAFMILANIAVFLLDCWALQWMGLLGAFRSRNPQAAWWKTMFTVLGLPWLGVWGYFAVMVLLMGQVYFEFFGRTATITWLICSVAADLFFGLRAKFKLQSGLRTAALERLTDGKSGAVP